jgi:DNA-binding transcriptional LysR family regulator
VNEGFDCAVRVGDLPDSSLVSLRLADNRRVCVTTPEYIKRHGAPKTPQDLAHHNCLAFSSVASQPRGWVFRAAPASQELLHTRVSGNMDCTDGQVLLDWCRAGLGIAWRSWWEVGTAVQRGELVTVLDDHAAPPNAIYAVFAQRKHMPLRVRLWIDYLKATYGNAQYWEG